MNTWSIRAVQNIENQDTKMVEAIAAMYDVNNHLQLLGIFG